MERSALLSTDRSAAWLASLIEATEVVAACTGPCDAAILKSFNDHLEMQADIRPPCEAVRISAAS